MQEANPTMPGEAPPPQAPAMPGPGTEPAIADARALQILLTVVGMRMAIGRQARAESRFPTPD